MSPAAEMLALVLLVVLPAWGEEWTNVGSTPGSNTTHHCSNNTAWGLDKRCWITYRPPNIIEPAKLVIFLHGYQPTEDVGLLKYDDLRYAGWRQIADEEGFVLVQPGGRRLTEDNMLRDEDFAYTKANNPDDQALEGSVTEITNASLDRAYNGWDAGMCCMRCENTEIYNNTMGGDGGGGEEGKDNCDVQFVAHVAEQVAAELSIKELSRHVYWAGHSTGCMLAQRVAVVRPDIVAAVGCHSGLLALSPCELASLEQAVKAERKYKPKPVILVHGNADTIVPFGTQDPDDRFWEVTLDLQKPPIRLIPRNNTCTDISLENKIKYGAFENLLRWKEQNKCTGPRVTHACGSMEREEQLYSIHSFYGCGYDSSDASDQVAVRLVEVKGAGHVPFSRKYLPLPYNLIPTPWLEGYTGLDLFVDLDTTDMVWQFMKTWSGNDTEAKAKDAFESATCPTPPTSRLPGSSLERRWDADWIAILDVLLGAVLIVSLVWITLDAATPAPTRGFEDAPQDTLQDSVDHVFTKLLGIGKVKVFKRRSDSEVMTIQTLARSTAEAYHMLQVLHATNGSTVTHMLVQQLQATNYTGPMPTMVTTGIQQLLGAGGSGAGGSDGSVSESMMLLVIAIVACGMLLVAMVVVGALVYLWRAAPREENATPEAVLEIGTAELKVNPVLINCKPPSIRPPISAPIANQLKPNLLSSINHKKYQS